MFLFIIWKVVVMHAWDKLHFNIVFFISLQRKNKYLNSDYYFKIKGHIYVVLKSESKCKMNEINEHNW